MSKHIYLDYNATTPLDPKISDLVEPLHTEKFGNAASSGHQFGQDAKKLIERSRNQIARGINCDANEITFTSGATEAINTAIKGITFASKGRRKHIIAISTEHKAVIDTCVYLEGRGVQVDYLSVDENGHIPAKKINSKIKPETILVVVMHGNNEIGTIQPISEIGRICSEHGVPLLVDAAQTFGKIPIDVRKSNISMLAGSAHKIYGPKGCGFLYKRSMLKIDPLMHGGGHEMGLRSGTHNVPGIVGMALALQLMEKHRTDENTRLEEYAVLFKDLLTKSGIEFYLNGPEKDRLPGNLNICLKGVDADWLTTMIPEIAIARGSACTSETIQPSHVLRAIGLTDEDANSSIRISFGRFTTKDEVIRAANLIIKQVNSFIEKKEIMAI